MTGWVHTSATVTGNLHGADGPASNGRDRFAPSYEFADTRGQRWLGQSDIYSRDQAIIGTTIPVAYNPANPNESFHVSSQTRTTLGCLIAFFAVFAVVLFWFIGIFPLG